VTILAAKRNYFAFPPKLIWCTRGNVKQLSACILIAHRPVIWQGCVLVCLLHMHRSTLQFSFKINPLITISLWKCRSQRKLQFILNVFQYGIYLMKYKKNNARL
jgi:hypothetical protein